jgi:hypothetical protein
MMNREPKLMEKVNIKYKKIKNLVTSINVVNLNVGSFITHIPLSIIIVRSLTKVFFLQIHFTMANHSKDPPKIEEDLE